MVVSMVIVFQLCETITEQVSITILGGVSFNSPGILGYLYPDGTRVKRPTTMWWMNVVLDFMGLPGWRLHGTSASKIGDPLWMVAVEFMP